MVDEVVVVVVHHVAVTATAAPPPSPSKADRAPNPPVRSAKRWDMKPIVLVPL